MIEGVEAGELARAELVDRRGAFEAGRRLRAHRGRGFMMFRTSNMAFIGQLSAGRLLDQVGAVRASGSGHAFIAG